MIFRKAINNDTHESMNILLTGSRGTGKTLFLDCIKKNIKHVHFVSNVTSGPGLMDYLSTHPDTSILCIDELEKIPKQDIHVLLDVMESQHIRSEKSKGKSYDIGMNLSIFATSNNIDKLSPELRSRFLVFELRDYTREEFYLIGRRLLEKRYPQKIAIYQSILDGIWNQIHSNDIRDIIKLARLCSTVEEVDKVIAALKYYGPTTNNDYLESGEE